MKKRLALLLALALMAATVLSGCGGKEEKKDEGKSESKKEYTAKEAGDTFIDRIRPGFPANGIRRR